MFRTDTKAECELLKRLSIESGAEDAVVCSHWTNGGAGAATLADAVIKACSKKEDNFQ